jgi:hypothetical protein
MCPARPRHPFVFRLQVLVGMCAALSLPACEGQIVLPDPSRVIVPVPPGGVKPIPPGPPPKCEPVATVVPKLLRLSNFEYRTIASDLLGVPLNDTLFAQWTPVAQVYGFDTMSETRIDAQALEEQFATAESLSSLVLATPELTKHCPAVRPVQTPRCTLKSRYSALDDFSDSQGRDCWSYLDSSGVPMVFDNAEARWRKEPDQTVLLWPTGAHPGTTLDAVRRWLSPVDGSVTIAGSFGDADPGGGDGVLVRILKNGAAVFTQDVPNGGQAPFNLTLTVVQGDLIDFVVNRKATPSNDTTSFSAAIAFTGIPRKLAWTWANCGEPLVARLASRSFRRPVRTAELAEYAALFETSRQGAATAGFAEPVDEAMVAALQAVFLSPNFVFKPELVPGGLDPSEAGFGVAARLGLFFRSSIVDEELWMLAGTGGLSDANAVRVQTERMLEQNVDRFATHFGGQWLDYREVAALGPLTASMQDESREIFKAVLSEDLAPESLIKPGFTSVDSSLAAFYQLPVSDMGGQRYRLNTTERGGLLSQALFLSRTGNGSEFRRPIHRGLWVLTRLLCRSLPHLDAATLEEISLSFGAIDQSLPLPQKMAIHRTTSARCGGCHNLMDPIGLALEKYDPQGNWRDRYPNGARIKTSLKFDNTIVRDPHELATAIADSTDYRTCVATKLLTFGLNRGPLPAESCVAQRIGRPLDGTLPTFKEMTLDALTHALDLTTVKP